MVVLVKLAFTPVYWAWVYYVLGLIVIWLCRRDRVALTVVLSGIMCESGLFIAAPAVDYRYSHWMVTCAIVAAVYSVAARIKASSMPSARGNRGLSARRGGSRVKAMLGLLLLSALLRGSAVGPQAVPRDRPPHEESPARA
jgi:hypothetical protein